MLALYGMQPVHVLASMHAGYDVICTRHFNAAMLSLLMISVHAGSIGCSSDYMWQHPCSWMVVEQTQTFAEGQSLIGNASASISCDSR